MPVMPDLSSAKYLAKFGPIFGIFGQIFGKFGQIFFTTLERKKTRSKCNKANLGFFIGPIGSVYCRNMFQEKNLKFEEKKL